MEQWLMNSTSKEQTIIKWNYHLFFAVHVCRKCKNPHENRLQHGLVAKYSRQSELYFILFWTCIQLNCDENDGYISLPSMLNIFNPGFSATRVPNTYSEWHKKWLLIVYLIQSVYRSWDKSKCNMRCNNIIRCATNKQLIRKRLIYFCCVIPPTWIHLKV